MGDNGGTTISQWTVKEPRPWWHRGAAVAAMVAFANALGFLWAREPWAFAGTLAIAGILAIMDSAVNK